MPPNKKVFPQQCSGDRGEEHCILLRRWVGFAMPLRTSHHRTTTHPGLARNKRVFSTFPSNLLLCFVTGQSMLPFFLPVMQFQRRLTNFLHNSVELHQTPTSVAAAAGARGQEVQTQAAAEGFTPLHPPSANKNKRRIKSVSRRVTSSEITQQLESNQSSQKAAGEL